MRCVTRLSDGEELKGELIRSNFHTVVMKVYYPKKKGDKLIKRHKKRRNVNILS